LIYRNRLFEHHGNKLKREGLQPERERYDWVACSLAQIRREHPGVIQAPQRPFT
jgi:hypothetical protein